MPVMELEREAVAALDRGELVLHFQPKAQLASGAVDAVEALVRWSHPRLGVLGPAALLGAIERRDGLGALTDWVLDQALSQHAAWRREGRDLTVCINVDPVTMLSPGMVDRVAAALRAHEVSGRALSIEVTEGALLLDHEAAAAAIGRLRTLGVAVAIDDFGTGWSSLARLRRLPFDELKIDQSFVAGMGVDPDDRAIVTVVVDLARHFELRVVAEGVEDAEQAAWLAALGCDVIQGFHVAPPLPADEVLAAIDAWTGVETEPPEALPSAPRREPGLPVGARLERMAALADADETALVSWILEALGWDVGVLWVRDDHEPLLRCSTVVCAPGIEAHELTRQSRAVTYRPGVGIPGGVWRRGAPVWNEDLRGTNRMPRARAAHAAGLRGALHLPLRDEHGTVSAVLELHSRAVQPRDRGLLEELTAAGDGPLGRAFAAAHRRGRAAADARVSAAVAHARALLDGRAAAPARRALCQAVLELTGTDLVLLFEPWEDQLQATASAGGEIGLPALQLEGQGVSATVGAYRSGRAAYVGDLRSGAAASAHLAAAWNLRAGFFQPVLGTDGRSLGVIVAAWREGGRRPSTAVRRVIDELLHHAAPLLERT